MPGRSEFRPVIRLAAMTVPASRLFGDAGGTSPPELRASPASWADANCSLRVAGAEAGATWLSGAGAIAAATGGDAGPVHVAIRTMRPGDRKRTRLKSSH